MVLLEYQKSENNKFLVEVPAPTPISEVLDIVVKGNGRVALPKSKQPED